MVREGRTAVVHFTARLLEGDDAGEVFDTSDVDVAIEEGIYHDNRDYRPLEFRVGDGEVLEGIEDAVREMDVGETRTVRLEPEEAFGERAESRVVEVPRDHLAEGGTDVEEGDLVGDDAGETGWITDVGEETVTVDFNHELAGERVAVEVRVLDARDAGE